MQTRLGETAFDQAGQTMYNSHPLCGVHGACHSISIHHRAQTTGPLAERGLTSSLGGEPWASFPFFPLTS